MFYLAIYENFLKNKPHLETQNKSEHVQKNWNNFLHPIWSQCFISLNSIANKSLIITQVFRDKNPILLKNQ